MVDTNCSPEGVDYIIPGNDDAARAIALYCDLVARAALDGMTAQLGAAGVDIGALEEAPEEEAVDRRRRGLKPRRPAGLSPICYRVRGCPRPDDRNSMNRGEP